MSGGYVTVEPRRLRFVGASADRALKPRQVVHLVHGSREAELIAFKIQTNAVKRFNVLPAQGYVHRGETIEVVIQHKADHGWSENDKFLVRAVPVEDDSRPIHEVWAREHADMQKVVVRCEFVDREDRQDGPALVPSSLLRGAKANQQLGEEGGVHDEAKYNELLVKNLSSRVEDRLTIEELEALQQLRSRVGPQKWAEMQATAHEMFNRRNDKNSSINKQQQQLPPKKEREESSEDTREVQSDETVTDLLSKGIRALQGRRLHESIDAFQGALKKATVGTVTRAQVLVGLGSAYEASGLLDRALDCYIDALRIYDRVNDVGCKESVSSAIANVYSEMRDHTMAAAWNEEQLDLIGNDPANGTRRAPIIQQRDHHMRIGRVTPTLLASARGKIAGMLASSHRRHSYGVVVDVEKLKPAAKSGVDTLWEPSSLSSSSFNVTSPRSSGSASSSSMMQDKAKPVKLAKPLTNVSSGALPHYLSATVASRASRIDHRPPPTQEYEADEQPPTHVDDFAPPPSRSSFSSDYTKYSANSELVDKRNREAAQQHVRRALEARRRKDQMSGLRPPSLKRQMDNQEQEARHEKSRGSDMVYLDVVTLPDQRSYTVALPGPLEVAMEMTVREMRERVSFVTGVNLHDFELVVDGTPLSDSWLGRDLGLGNRTQVELSLLPHVRPDKYMKPVISPTSVGERGEYFVQTNNSRNMNGAPTRPLPSQQQPQPQPLQPQKEDGNVNGAGSPRHPMRPPPISPPSAFSPTQQNGDPSSPSSPYGKEPYSAKFDDLESLCNIVQTTVEGQKRAASYADEIHKRAFAILLDGELDEENEDDEDGEEGDDDKGVQGLSSFTGALMERIVALEAELDAVKIDKRNLQGELELAKQRVVELSMNSARGEAMHAKMSAEIGELKRHYTMLANDTKANLANFREMLWQHVKLVKDSSPIKPQFMVILNNAEDDECFMRTMDGELSFRLKGVDPSSPNGGKKSIFKTRGGVPTARLGESIQIKYELDNICGNIQAGRCTHSYLFSLGKPGIFVRPEKKLPSVMVAMVSLMFEKLQMGSLKVSAAAVSSLDGSIIDLLEPEPGNQANATQAPSYQVNDHRLSLENVVVVKFSNIEEFRRVYHVVVAQVAGLSDRFQRNIVVNIETEGSSEGVLFTQTGSFSGCYDNELMHSIFQVASVVNENPPHTVLFFANGDRTLSGDTLAGILAHHFPSLCTN